MSALLAPIAGFAKITPSGDIYINAFPALVAIILGVIYWLRL